MWLYWRPFLVGLGILGRRRRDLILENLILRQQLAVCERSGRRANAAAKAPSHGFRAFHHTTVWQRHGLCQLQHLPGRQGFRRHGRNLLAQVEHTEDSRKGHSHGRRNAE